MAKVKKVKDKQREKHNRKKEKEKVGQFFEELKADTITYECTECGAETQVPRAIIEMNMGINEYGDVHIPGYACQVCDRTAMPKNPEDLYFKFLI